MAKLKNKITDNKNKLNQKAANKRFEQLKLQMKAYMDNSKFVEAMDVMAEMASNQCMDAEVMSWGAICYYTTGDYDRAVAWINNTLTYDSENIKMRMLLARICLEQDREETGLKIYEMLLTQFRAKLSEEDIKEIKDQVEYFKYSGPEKLEPYTAIKELLQMKKEAVPDQVPTANTEQDPQAKARAAVERLKAMLKKAKQQEAEKEKLEAADDAEPIPGEVDDAKEECSGAAAEADKDEDKSFATETVLQQIMAKPVSLQEKLRMLNAFASGCYISGNYQAAFDLLSQALQIDAVNPEILRNIAYVCAAAGEKEQAMEFASKMPMVDFGVLNSIK